MASMKNYVRPERRKFKMPNKIIILDDQKDYLRSLALALSGSYEVFSFTDISSAKQSLSKEISAVLVDICLNETEANNRDGLLFIEEVRKGNPIVPILAISGIQDSALPEQTIKAGANKFLKKPINIAELRQLLKELIK